MLVVVLLPAALVCFWHQQHQRLAGCCLQWQAGQWAIIDSRGITRPIEIQHSVCLPWVVALFWVEGNQSRWREAWLFTDSASANDMRRLRVRLKLCA